MNESKALGVRTSVSEKRNGDTHSEWVECSKAMPPDNALYLVYAPSCDPEKPMISLAWYEPNGFGWSLTHVWCEAITHWARLPKRPLV